MPPETSLGPRFTVERQADALPSIAWRWDPETDILSGTFRSSGSSRLDGTIELTDAEGAIAVRIFHKPLVLLIWWGPVLIAFGGLLSLSDRRLRVGAPKPAKKPDKASRALQPAE